jgi:F-type H+-transporting ATPase subunit b
MSLYLADASATPSLLDLTSSFLAEVIAFVLMILILGRWVYPVVMRVAEARQRQISEQLAAAERSRQEAEARLRDAEASLQEARGRAAEILEGAGRSGDQLRAELRGRAEEDAKRVTENALRDIEAERRKAVESVRGEVADLVVAATEKVVGETLDDQRHRKLIDQAIAQVGREARN